MIWFFPTLFRFLDKGRMTPPHAPFKYLFRRHMWLNSRHSLDRAEAQHLSTETVSTAPEGGLDSSDEPQPTAVGELNKDPQPSEVPLVSCVDCAFLSGSGSGHFLNEQARAAVTSFERRGSGLGVIGSLAVGGPTDLVSSVSVPSLSLPNPSLPVPPPFLPTLPVPSPFLPTLPIPSPFPPNVIPTLPLPLTYPTLSATSDVSSFTPSASIPASIPSMTTSSTQTVFTPTVSDTASAPIFSGITSTPLLTTTKAKETSSISDSRMTSTQTSTPLPTSTESEHKTRSKHTSLLSTTSTSTTDSPSPSTTCVPSADDSSDCLAFVSAYQSLPSLLSNSCTDCSTSIVTTFYIHSPVVTSDVSETSTTATASTASTTFITTFIPASSDSSVAPSPSPTNTTSQSGPPAKMKGAIAGGTIGAVTILGLLIYIVMRYRSRKMFSITPFNIPSTESPPAPSRNLKYARMRANTGRPNSAASSFIQYPDACHEFESRSVCLSYSTDPAASFMYMSDEDERHASASTIARFQRDRELEKLYPSPRIRTASRFDSGENWVGRMEGSREPSEELPAYPRSTKSQKSTSREANRGDDHFVLPSSHPLLPELHLSLSLSQ